jgi:uncharacterized paraquat-inducible protein A
MTRERAQTVDPPALVEIACPECRAPVAVAAIGQPVERICWRCKALLIITADPPRDPMFSRVQAGAMLVTDAVETAGG